jgi:hypothetical protein
VSDFIAINTLPQHICREALRFEAINYRYEGIAFPLIRFNYHDPMSFPPSRVQITCGNEYTGMISFWLNFNPSMPASVHCTDLLILQMLPTSVHRTSVNAFKYTVISKPIRTEQQLQFQPQRH